MVVSSFFGDHIFLSNFFKVNMDILPLDIQPLNFHEYDGEGILWPLRDPAWMHYFLL